MKPRKNRQTRTEPMLGEMGDQDHDVEINLRKPVRNRRPDRPAAEAGATKPEFEIKKPAIIVASLLLVISSVVVAFDQLFNPDSFQIEELRISADFDQLHHQQIRQQVLPLIQKNYFAVNLKQIEQVVGNIPWVDQVSVRRQWPRSIHIHLTEQQAVAHWGDNAYLNSRGQPFEVEQKIDGDMPYLFGPPGTEKELLNQLSSWTKQLSRKNLTLERLILTPRYSYEIRVNISRAQQKQLTEQALMSAYEKDEQPVLVLDWHKIAEFGITLKLGKQSVERRLERFISAFPQAFDDRLLNVATVDLRYPNGFAVQFSETDFTQQFLQLAAKFEQNINE